MSAGAPLPSARTILGRNLRKARKTIGLSQEDFGFACNLHRNYIGSIERGERNVSIDSMERIAGALSVKVSDLLNGDFVAETSMPFVARLKAMADAFGSKFWRIVREAEERDEREKAAKS